MLAKLKGFKTLIFNAIMAGLLLWRTLRPSDPVPSEVEVTSILEMLFNSLDALLLIGNVILRFRTDTAVGKAV